MSDKIDKYLSHTNRQVDTAYMRAVSTAKGGTRYYITKDPKAADLLEEMPSGFEFYEYKLPYVFDLAPKGLNEQPFVQL